ncbi:MAG: Trm112 family protein [Pseudomonadota bacterium]
MADKRDQAEAKTPAETEAEGSKAGDSVLRPASECDTVDPRILEVLVCPLTKTRLRFDKSKNELISTAAGLAYPIRDGVPMMSMEAARQLSTDEN